MSSLRPGDPFHLYQQPPFPRHIAQHASGMQQPQVQANIQPSGMSAIGLTVQINSISPPCNCININVDMGQPFDQPSIRQLPQTSGMQSSHARSQSPLQPQIGSMRPSQMQMLPFQQLRGRSRVVHRSQGSSSGPRLGSLRSSRIRPSQTRGMCDSQENPMAMGYDDSVTVLAPQYGGSWSRRRATNQAGTGMYTNSALRRVQSSSIGPPGGNSVYASVGGRR